MGIVALLLYCYCCELARRWSLGHPPFLVPVASAVATLVEEGMGWGLVCEGLELVVSIGLSQNRTPSHRGRGVLVPLGNMVVVYGEIFS